MLFTSEKGQSTCEDGEPDIEDYIILALDMESRY